MVIEEGRFYFISNDFIQKYGKKYNLMDNKETGNKRPCYFCFKDKENANIIWFVPVSKQYDKYIKIYSNKKEKMKREPLNFVFGSIKDIKSVFLIQNMFPCKEEYIIEKYTNNNEDVLISEVTQDKVIRIAERVLKIARERNIHIAFSNLIEFKKELLNE